jgi:predicted TIM-barrel fold metal-dependent hydrolase
MTTADGVGLFDLHTHLPRPAPERTAAEVRADAMRFMDAHGVKLGLVMPLAGLSFDPPTDNDAVLGVCSGSGGRLVPACTVQPHDPDALDELDRCARLGVRAVKLHPWLQAFSPLEPAVVALAQRAAQLGLPLVIHDGTPPYASPLQIGELAARVPACTVVLAHGGLMDLWQDAVAAVNRWPNVMVTLCGTASRRTLAQVLAGVPDDRVSVGTDAGFGDPDMAVHRLVVLRRIAEQLPDDLAAALLHGNAARWMSLQ